MLKKRRNYYEVLGIPKTATLDQIRRGYKKSAMRWHPDKNLNDIENARQRFAEIYQAYQILSDSQTRQFYDTQGILGITLNGQKPTIYDQSDAYVLFERFFRFYGFANKYEQDFFNSISNRRFANNRCDSTSSASSLTRNNSFDSIYNKSQGSYRSKFTDNHPKIENIPGMTTKYYTKTTQFVNGKTIIKKKTTFVKQGIVQKITQQVIQGSQLSIQQTYITPSRPFPYRQQN